MKMKDIKFMTSNSLKRAELEKKGYTVIDGEVPEVMGTPDEVILHKAKLVDAGVAVEDTYIELEGQPIVDWKTAFAEHKDSIDGKEFTWVVRIAYHDGENIFVYDGRLNCKFDLQGQEVDTPAFDHYARIHGMMNNELIEELKQKPNWFSVDPRSRALYNMTWNENSLKVPLAVMQDWTGEYQP